ncbi:MAG TPA: sulfatase-like hydrolase/transferase [Methylomirabilota bacterium]|jgi:N-acetylglucosamine-6-sulfatase
MTQHPNILVILVDDLRFDEFGAGGHPYMETPHIDRLAHEGVHFTRAFHPTPICSPNRASILTGQYASRHGIIDNVARDALSHRLPNYHRVLQGLGYETAHVGKWHMGNDASPRPGYHRWVSFKGHGSLFDPELNEDGAYRRATGYVTDLLNEHALAFVASRGDRPWSLFLAHKAVHPDAYQAPDGTLDLTKAGGGYKPAPRHRDLYRGREFPRRPNMLPPGEVARSKPAWAEAFALRAGEQAQAALRAIHAGTQEEIRLRAAMMASVDEGVGALLRALERRGQLERTFILFLGDNGYFFGEHALGPERRFAYEEGIRSPFVIRYPPLARPGTTASELVLTLDVAPTVLELAGATPGRHVQGRSLVPLLAGRQTGWRDSFLVEYFAESALGWLVGMTYKAVRTERHKLIHWVNRDGVDELYDLESDPYEVVNVIADPRYARVHRELRVRLAGLVAEAVGL